MQIPLIDLSKESSLTPGEIDHALREVGFMLVQNPGIDATLLQQVYTASKAFFTGDESIKQACRYRNAEENFGYQGMAEENLDPSAPADLKETFTMRNIIGRPLPPDRWPSDAFRKLMLTFFEAVLQTGYHLQQQLEQALDLPDGFFQQCHTGENITLRLLYYPDRGVDHVAEAQMGAGAHTDYGLMTLLFQDDVGGLQVMSMDQQWLDVEPIENSVVINSGDLLERWTNGQYRSTVHRVVPKIGHRERLSIAMFVDPDSDTQVTTLPSCIDDTHPNQYPTISAGAHLQEKISATHKERFS